MQVSPGSETDVAVAQDGYNDIVVRPQQHERIQNSNKTRTQNGPSDQSRIRANGLGTG